MASSLIVVGAILLLSSVTIADQADQDTCGLTQKDGVNAFVLQSTSPTGEIPLIHVQYDTNRQLPITSTVIYDQLNRVQNVNRTKEPFREILCSPLVEKQQDCSEYMSLSVSQKDKIKAAFNSWNRGHLTPVNPMRFSEHAVNTTFYCVNIAPQEPWSNKCPWFAVEERTLYRTKEFPSYVMTGVCSEDNDVDGKTYDGLIVPKCFWKMQCYVDPVTKKTQVVGFVQENTLIPPKNINADKLARKASTYTPRSQQEIKDMMGKQAAFINKAWTAAEKELQTGREITGQLPTASACGRVKDITVDVVENWNAFMNKHKPHPFNKCYS